jgi:hypothetical protein
MFTHLWRPTGRRTRSQRSTPNTGPKCHVRRLSLESLEDRCLLSVDPILEWNAVMIQADAVDHSGTVHQQPGPILSSRAFAMTSAAMYDALDSIAKIGTPYLTVAPDAAGASVDAAVAQAAYDTLAALYSAQTVAFDAALSQTLARLPNGPNKDRGIAVGHFVANSMLKAHADDGAANINNPPYVPIDAPGFHQVDPTNPNQGFYAPDAGHMTPFTLTRIDQFTPSPLDDGTIPGRAAFLRRQDYTFAYYEEFALGGNGTTTPTVRTPEQTEIGIYWGYDGRPGLGTPPRLYNQIVRVLAEQENNTVEQNARLFALVNLAMADGGLSCWSRKYQDNFWRPIMGIRNGDHDGNPVTLGDPNWTPLGAQASNPRPGEVNFTPSFPSYTSGHATFGAAVFETLERFYSKDDIRFTFISDEFNGITRGADGQARPIVARTYHSFSQAAFENAESRIYLGIHWSFDRDEGIKCGNAVANYVFDNFLQPNTQPPGGARAGRSEAIAALLGNTGSSFTVGFSTLGPRTEEPAKGWAVRSVFAVAQALESTGIPAGSSTRTGTEHSSRLTGARWSTPLQAVDHTFTTGVTVFQSASWGSRQRLPQPRHESLMFGTCQPLLQHL